MSPPSRDAREGERPGSSGAWGTALRDAAPYIGIGTTLAATVLLGTGVGYWLDLRLKTDPWFLFAGGVVGICVAMYQFFRTVAGLRK